MNNEEEGPGRTHYFVNLGSNVAARQNVVAMLRALLDISAMVDASPILRTQPVGIESTNPFLNLVVRLKTNLEPIGLKSYFNEIEEELGRDRLDPDRGLKDRPADLDILFALPEDTDRVGSALLPTESYIRPLLLTLIHDLGLKCVVPRPDLGESVPIFIDSLCVGLHSMRLERAAGGDSQVIATRLSPTPVAQTHRASHE